MTLKDRTLEYLRKHKAKNPNNWIHKGQLEALAKQAGYLAETVDRELRLLVEEGLIENRYVGKSQEYRHLW